ncbi:hypothetical protein NECAME_03993 [Necator americanus]|uniref:Uncharacterized protein n=1 Tax=Necator americanus TaxID=51031 RepID=W2T0K7_NECAM|nr:hypothetical protein NECAME_03993 [Necator americanus]ETN74507.1 hypothetical protein NECAME_03993 [Necator americanus]
MMTGSPPPKPVPYEVPSRTSTLVKHQKQLKHRVKRIKLRVLLLSSPVSEAREARAHFHPDVKLGQEMYFCTTSMCEIVSY